MLADEPRAHRITTGAEFEPSGLLPLPLSHSAYLRLGDDKQVAAPECSVNHSVHLMGLLVGDGRQEGRSHLPLEGLGSETAVAWPPEALIPRDSLSSNKTLDSMMGGRANWREGRLLSRTLGSQLFRKGMAVSQWAQNF